VCVCVCVCVCCVTELEETIEIITKIQKEAQNSKV
jgi:hypothetical protein